MPMYKILIVEDHKNTQEELRAFLEGAGFDVRVTGNGRRALIISQQESPDLIVLDYYLTDEPDDQFVNDLTGIDVLIALRQRGDQYPIIFLTVEKEDGVRVNCLDKGADNYLVKPFSNDSLRAHIQAELRRFFSQPNPLLHSQCLRAESEVLRSDQQRSLISLNRMNRRVVRLNGAEVAVSPQTFDLLLYFMINPQRIITRGEIQTEVLGHKVADLSGNIDQMAVNRLREKLFDPQIAGMRSLWIDTVWGKGYKFMGRVKEESCV